jgi:hypothetical protein
LYSIRPDNPNTRRRYDDVIDIRLSTGNPTVGQDNNILGQSTVQRLIHQVFAGGAFDPLGITAGAGFA